MDSLAPDIAFAPVEIVEGPTDAGVLLLCDHARNALPPAYGALGLPPEALERHIAYDIGARALTLGLAERLRAPAVLSTFSRLLIDPNRGEDDPTLVMRYSDGAVVPGNARADGAEIARRIARYWRPYREAVLDAGRRMAAAGSPPAVVSMHTFTPIWRGTPRPWKIGLLYDADDRLARRLMAALAQDGLEPHEIGDNEPYSGGLPGDTIDAVAHAHGLHNVLIEVRQDLVATPEGADAWAGRLAPLIAGALGDLRPSVMSAKAEF
jgi:predicted N-formylglutamate amidohydrolase